MNKKVLYAVATSLIIIFAIVGVYAVTNFMGEEETIIIMGFDCAAARENVVQPKYDSRL